MINQICRWTHLKWFSNEPQYSNFLLSKSINRLNMNVYICFPHFGLPLSRKFWVEGDRFSFFLREDRWVVQYILYIQGLLLVRSGRVAIYNHKCERLLFFSLLLHPILMHHPLIPISFRLFLVHNSAQGYDAPPKMSPFVFRFIIFSNWNLQNLVRYFQSIGWFIMLPNPFSDGNGFSELSV